MVRYDISKLMKVIKKRFWNHIFVTLSGKEAGAHKNNWQLCSLIKKIGLLGRQLLPKYGVINITTEHLPANKGLQSSCEVDTKITANVLRSQRNTSTSSRQGHREAGTDGQAGILEPVQPRGVAIASPVMCQRKKWRTETLRGLESA